MGPNGSDADLLEVRQYIGRIGHGAQGPAVLRWPRSAQRLGQVTVIQHLREGTSLTAQSEGWLPRGSEGATWSKPRITEITDQSRGKSPKRNPPSSTQALSALEVKFGRSFEAQANLV